MFLANSLASQHELTPELWFLSSSTPQRLYLPTLHRQQSCPRRWGFRPWALAATGVGAQTSSGGFPVAVPSLMHFGSPMPQPLAQLTGEEQCPGPGCMLLARKAVGAHCLSWGWCEWLEASSSCTIYCSGGTYIESMSAWGREVSKLVFFTTISSN